MGGAMRCIIFMTIVFVSVLTSRANSPLLAAPGASHSRFQDRYSALDRLQNALSSSQAPEIAQILGRKYRQDFLPVQTKSRLSQLDASELRAVLQAATVVNFYAPSKRLISDMELDLGVLGSRATNGDYEQLYTALVAGRDLAAAQRLQRAHMTVPQDRLPRLVDGRSSLDDPSDLVLAGDGSVITRETVNLRGPRMIVIASPLCHFCQNAARSFDENARLQTFLRNHSLWIVPPDGWLSFKTLRRWNAAHPFEQMNLIYSNADWPMLNVSSTPTFYFFNDHRLVAKVSGWPSKGNTSAVLNGMRRIGLPPPNGV